VGNPEGSVRIIAFKEIKSERWISAQSGTVPEYMKGKFKYATTHSGREYPILRIPRNPVEGQCVYMYEVGGEDPARGFPLIMGSAERVEKELQQFVLTGGGAEEGSLLSPSTP
jgi:hypothetical protein